MFQLDFHDRGVLLPGLEDDQNVRNRNDGSDLDRFLTLRKEVNPPIMAEVWEIYPTRVYSLDFSSTNLLEVINVKVLCPRPFWMYGIPASYFEVKS